jgi:hypothetical protein
MVLPLTLYRLWRWLVLRRSNSALAKRANIAASVYLVLAILQLIALILSESRGPLLGLLASFGFLGVALAVSWRRPWLLLLPLLSVGLPLLLVAILNLPLWAASQTLRSFPVLGRYSSLFRTREGTGFFRTDLWNQVPRVIGPGSPLPFPGGGADSYNWLRPFLGYGSEALSSVLPHYYSVPQPDPPLENRFHNLTWDLWTSTGAVGLAIFLGVVTSLFFSGYRRLGLLVSAGAVRLYWTLVPGLATAGALTLAAWHGIGYAGVGLQAGLVAGLAAFPLAAQLRKGPDTELRPRHEPRSVLLIVLLAALAGHLVETAFSFQVASTTVFFWGFAGMALALILADKTAADPQSAATVPIPRPTQAIKASSAGPKKAPRATHSPPPEKSSTGLFAAIWTALLVLPFLYSFISAYSQRELSPTEILNIGLTRLDGRPGETALTLVLLVLTWLGAAFAFTADEDLSRGNSGRQQQLGLALTASGSLLGLYALFKAIQVALLCPFPSANAVESFVLSKCLRYEWLYLEFVAVTLALVLLNAFLTSRGSTQADRHLPKLQIVSVGGAALMALVVIWFTNLNSIRADIALFWANTLDAQQVRPGSTDVYQRAIQLSPGTFYYRSKLAESLNIQAATAPPDGSFDRLMEQAERVLLDAQKLGTLNRGYYHLGEMYTAWADHERDPGKRSALAQKANQAFERALVFEPQTEAIWVASANVDEVFLDHPGEAARKRAKARELVAHRDAVSFGEAYLEKSGRDQSPVLSRCEALQALAYFNLALTNAVATPPNAFQCELGKAKAWLRLSNLGQALEASRAAIKVAADTNVWLAEELVARIYAQSGNKAAAAEQVARAISHAPPDAKARLYQLRSQNEQIQ